MLLKNKLRKIATNLLIVKSFLNVDPSILFRNKIYQDRFDSCSIKINF